MDDWDDWTPDGYVAANMAQATHFVLCWRDREKPGRIFRGPVLRLELYKPGHLMTVLTSETHTRTWAEYFTPEN